MGRNAQPIDILTKKGLKHLTKAEIEARKAAEVKTGNTYLRCPDYIKNDINAFKRWKEIIKIYKDSDFISSGDVGMLARYCMTHSEYLKLIENRKHIESLEVDWDQYNGVLPEDLEFRIEMLLKLSPLLQIETAINKKMDLLIKMEDRSFLNPLAKVKNIPKKEVKKYSPLEAAGFGDI